MRLLSKKQIIDFSPRSRSIYLKDQRINVIIKSSVIDGQQKKVCKI